MVDEVKVKGQAFHSVLGALGELKGSAFCQTLKRELRGDLGTSLRDGLLLPSGWYPVAWYRELLANASEQAQNVGLAREIGRASGRRETRGLYRLMFRMLATQTLVGQAPRFYRMFYRGGDAEVLEISSRHGLVRYDGCHGFDRSVWQDLLGGAEAGFETTGAQRLRLCVEEGGQNGDPHLVVRVTWQ